MNLYEMEKGKNEKNIEMVQVWKLWSEKTV